MLCLKIKINTINSLQTIPIALVVSVTCKLWVNVKLDRSGSSCYPLSLATVTGVPFPRNFLSMAKTILKRLFRVYAHIYHQHFPQVIQLEEEAHLNTSFKHFIFFVQEFGLVDKRELAPLQELIEKLTSKDRWGVVYVRLELIVAYVMSWTRRYAGSPHCVVATLTVFTWRRDYTAFSTEPSGVVASGSLRVEVSPGSCLGYLHHGQAPGCRWYTAACRLNIVNNCRYKQDLIILISLPPTLEGATLQVVF